MRKITIVYQTTGFLDLEVDKDASDLEIAQMFQDRVGFSEDDLYENLGEMKIFEIWDKE